MSYLKINLILCIFFFALSVFAKSYEFSTKLNLIKDEELSIEGTDYFTEKDNEEVVVQVGVLSNNSLAKSLDHLDEKIVKESFITSIENADSVLENKDRKIEKFVYSKIQNQIEVIINGTFINNDIQFNQVKYYLIQGSEVLFFDGVYPIIEKTKFENEFNSLIKTFKIALHFENQLEKKNKIKFDNFARYKLFLFLLLTNDAHAQSSSCNELNQSYSSKSQSNPNAKIIMLNGVINHLSIELDKSSPNSETINCLVGITKNQKKEIATAILNHANKKGCTVDGKIPSVRPQQCSSQDFRQIQDMKKYTDQSFRNLSNELNDLANEKLGPEKCENRGQSQNLGNLQALMMNQKEQECCKKNGDDEGPLFKVMQYVQRDLSQLSDQDKVRICLSKTRPQAGSALSSAADIGVGCLQNIGNAIINAIKDLITSVTSLFDMELIKALKKLYRQVQEKGITETILKPMFNSIKQEIATRSDAMTCMNNAEKTKYSCYVGTQVLSMLLGPQAIKTFVSALANGVRSSALSKLIASKVASSSLVKVAAKAGAKVTASAGVVATSSAAVGAAKKVRSALKLELNTSVDDVINAQSRVNQQSILRTEVKQQTSLNQNSQINRYQGESVTSNRVTVPEKPSTTISNINTTTDIPTSVSKANDGEIPVTVNRNGAPISQVNEVMPNQKSIPVKQEQSPSFDQQARRVQDSTQRDAQEVKIKDSQFLGTSTVQIPMGNSRVNASIVGSAKAKDGQIWHRLQHIDSQGKVSTVEMTEAMMRKKGYSSVKPEKNGQSSGSGDRAGVDQSTNLARNDEPGWRANPTSGKDFDRTYNEMLEEVRRTNNQSPTKGGQAKGSSSQTQTNTVQTRATPKSDQVTDRTPTSSVNKVISRENDPSFKNLAGYERRKILVDDYLDGLDPKHANAENLERAYQQMLRDDPQLLKVKESDVGMAQKERVFLFNQIDAYRSSLARQAAENEMWKIRQRFGSITDREKLEAFKKMSSEDKQKYLLQEYGIAKKLDELTADQAEAIRKRMLKEDKNLNQKDATDPGEVSLERANLYRKLNEIVENAEVKKTQEMKAAETKRQQQAAESQQFVRQRDAEIRKAGGDVAEPWSDKAKDEIVKETELMTKPLDELTDADVSRLRNRYDEIQRKQAWSGSIGTRTVQGLNNADLSLANEFLKKYDALIKQRNSMIERGQRNLAHQQGRTIQSVRSEVRGANGKTKKVSNFDSEINRQRDNPAQIIDREYNQDVLPADTNTRALMKYRPVVQSAAALQRVQSDLQKLGLNLSRTEVGKLNVLTTLDPTDIHFPVKDVQKLMEKMKSDPALKKKIMESDNQDIRRLFESVEFQIKSFTPEHLRKLDGKLSKDDLIKVEAAVRAANRSASTDVIQSRVNLSDSEKLRMSGLDRGARVKEAEATLGRKLSPDQQKALQEAHEIGKGFDEFTQADITRKGLLLRRAGFTKAETQKLLDRGIAGQLSNEAIGKIGKSSDELLNQARQNKNPNSSRFELYDQAATKALTESDPDKAIAIMKEFGEDPVETYQQFRKMSESGNDTVKKNAHQAAEILLPEITRRASGQVTDLQRAVLKTKSDKDFISANQKVAMKAMDIAKKLNLDSSVNEFTQSAYHALLRSGDIQKARQLADKIGLSQADQLGILQKSMTRVRQSVNSDQQAAIVQRNLQNAIADLNVQIKKTKTDSVNESQTFEQPPNVNSLSQQRVGSAINLTPEDKLNIAKQGSQTTSAKEIPARSLASQKNNQLSSTSGNNVQVKAAEQIDNPREAVASGNNLRLIGEKAQAQAKSGVAGVDELAKASDYYYRAAQLEKFNSPGAMRNVEEALQHSIRSDGKTAKKIFTEMSTTSQGTGRMNQMIDQIYERKQFIFETTNPDLKKLQRQNMREMFEEIKKTSFGKLYGPQQKMLDSMIRSLQP